MSEAAEKKDELPKEETKASGTEPAPDPEDDDLSQLLDSALGGFAKKKEGGEGSAAAAEGGPPDGFVIDQQMAQQAAKEFQNMLRQLAQVQQTVMEKEKSKGTEASAASAGGAPAAAGASGGEALGPIAQAALEAGLTGNSGAAGAAAGAPAADGTGEAPLSAEEEAAFAENLIKNLQGLADKAQKVTEAEGEEEFMKAMSDMHNNEAYTQEFLPFMQGLMGSLLSKDMMYPSLKEMTDQYPKWLEDNKANISKEDLERYEVQLGLMQEAVAEYDKETPEDSDEVVNQRMEKLIMIMQKMQMCGHPPEELVGKLPNGWAMSPDGVPQVTDQEQAAENCSVM